MFVQDIFETFKKDILAFNVDKFLPTIFVEDKFTQDTLEAFSNHI